jgi:hypothetical protein
MKELSPEARSLILEACQQDAPSAGRRARVKQRLAVSMAAAGAGAGAVQLARASAMTPQAAAALVPVASKAGLTLSAVALYVVGGAALGAATLIPLSIWNPVALESAQRVQAAKSGVPPTRDAHAAPASMRSALPAAPTVSESDRPEATKVAPSLLGSARERSTSRPASSSAPAVTALPLSLSAETRQLEAAQEQLAAGQGQRALEILDRHRAEFPAGALAEERDFARVIALCQLGRQSEASASAQAFLRATPSSPLVPRLRKSCAFLGGK